MKNRKREICTSGTVFISVVYAEAIAAIDLCVVPTVRFESCSPLW